MIAKSCRRRLHFLGDEMDAAHYRGAGRCSKRLGGDSSAAAGRTVGLAGQSREAEQHTLA